MTEKLPLGSFGPSLHPSQRDFFFLSSGVDPAKFDSKTLVCLPNISERGLWEVILDGISVDSGDLNLTGRTIIVETRGLSARLFLPKSIK